MPIGLKGNTDGSGAVQIGGSDAITISTGLNTTFEGTVTASGGVLYPLTSGTAIASTSGTALDFTDIPSWVKRVTVSFSGVSTNGSSNPLIQIGSGSVTTSGYSAYGAYVGSSSAATSYSTGFGLYAGAASNVLHGHAVLTLVTGNTWVCSINIGYTSSFLAIGSGNIALSGTLDRLRITTVNGTDTFDAGSINILYE
jgi:hypothetical protein